MTDFLVAFGIMFALLFSIAIMFIADIARELTKIRQNLDVYVSAEGDSEK
jgi:hypothetical protein